MSEVKVSVGRVEPLSWLWVVPSSPWFSLDASCFPPGFASVTWPSPLHASSPCIRTPVPGFTAHLNPVRLPLN